MNPLGTRMLCIYSVSEVFKGSILRACPLRLEKPEAAGCPCRRRIYVDHVSGQLRVLSCTFIQPPGTKPQTWDKKPIDNPAGLSRTIKEKYASKKPSTQKGKQKTMSTEAPAPQPELKKTESMDYAIMTLDRQMAFKALSRITDILGFINVVGQAIYESRMLGVSNIYQGKMIALACYLEGRSPFDYARTYHIIESKLSMRSEAMLANFRDRGGDHNQLVRDENTASIELVKGRKKQTYTFTWAMALKEDFVYTKAAISGTVPKALPDGTVNLAAIKDNYRTPWRRQQMLWARVVSDACTAFCPEVKGGCYTPEEFEAVMDADGNIIDAEFTEVSKTAQANQAKAETAPATYAEAAERAKVDPQPAAQQPPVEKPKPTPTEQPKPTESVVPPTSQASGGTNEPAPIAYPAKGEAGFDEFQANLLTHLKRLKDLLELSQEQYLKAVEKRGAKSAKEFDLKTLHEFVMKLEDTAFAGGKLSEAEHTIVKSLRPGN